MKKISWDVQSCLLMMEAVRTSETSVAKHFTRQYNPEDSSEHHTRRRENLKSHISWDVTFPGFKIRNYFILSSKWKSFPHPTHILACFMTFTLKLVSLRGVMIIVLAIRPKVRRFKPGRKQLIFKGDTNP
jgi:hypothetical protein